MVFQVGQAEGPFPSGGLPDQALNAHAPRPAPTFVGGQQWWEPPSQEADAAVLACPPNKPASLLPEGPVMTGTWWGWGCDGGVSLPHRPPPPSLPHSHRRQHPWTPGACSAGGTAHSPSPRCGETQQHRPAGEEKTELDPGSGRLLLLHRGRSLLTFLHALASTPVESRRLSSSARVSRSTSGAFAFLARLRPGSGWFSRWERACASACRLCCRDV